MSDQLPSEMIWIHESYIRPAETHYERPALYSLVHLGKTRVSLLKLINVNITEMWTWIHISASTDVDSSSYLSLSYQNPLVCIWFFPDTSIIMFANSESIKKNTVLF